MAKAKETKDTLGWREWVSLKTLNINKIKVKVDTGARTSALHATNIEFFKKNNKEFVRFKVHPEQRSKKHAIICEAPLIDTRSIKSSVGHTTKRPVIKTTLTVGPYAWEIELTLVNRDIMGFRMLLGREAMRGHFLVDPGKSYILGKGKEKTYVRKKKLKKS